MIFLLIEEWGPCRSNHFKSSTSSYQFELEQIFSMTSKEVPRSWRGSVFGCYGDGAMETGAAVKVVFALGRSWSCSLVGKRLARRLARISDRCLFLTGTLRQRKGRACILDISNVWV